MKNGWQPVLSFKAQKRKKIKHPTKKNNRESNCPTKNHVLKKKMDTKHKVQLTRATNIKTRTNTTSLPICSTRANAAKQHPLQSDRTSATKQQPPHFQKARATQEQPSSQTATSTPPAWAYARACLCPFAVQGAGLLSKICIDYLHLSDSFLILRT